MKEIREEVVENKEENIQEIKEDNFHKTNKRNKWKFIITGFLVIIALGIGLYFGYNRLGSNPLMVYKNVINEVYGNIDKAIKNQEKVTEINAGKDPFTLDINARLDTNMEELKALNNYNYNFKLALDYPQKQGSLGVGISNDNPIINVLVSLVDKNVYLKSEELLSKTLKVGEYDFFGELEKNITAEELEVLSSSNEDIRYLLKEYKDILIKSLNKDKFKLEKDTIKINGENKKVKKVTYILDEETLRSMTKVMVEEMVDNEELLEKTTKVLDLDKEELKDKLQELKDNDYKVEAFEGEDEQIVIYVDGFNSLVAASLISADKEEMRIEKIDDNVKIVIEDAEISCTFEGNLEEGTLKILDTDGEINMQYEIKKKDIVLDLEVITNEVSLKGNVTFENVKETKDKATADYKVSLQVKEDGETYKIALQGDLTVEKGNIEVVSTDDSVYYEDLSKNDLKELQKNLQDILKKFNLEDWLEV